MTPTPAPLTHLQRLRAESVHILREAVAQAERPVMPHPVGKARESGVQLVVRDGRVFGADGNAPVRREKLEGWF